MYDLQNTHNKKYRFIEKYRFINFCYGINDPILDRFLLLLF